ncbi:unnamed protein product, partial [marine sediment metagenome]
GTENCPGTRGSLLDSEWYYAVETEGHTASGLVFMPVKLVAS